MNKWKQALGNSCYENKRDKRNRNLAIGVYLLWIAAFVVSHLSIKKGWILDPWAIWALVLGTLGLGIAMFHTYRRFLIHADELTRKIELESLAFAFGVGLLLGVTAWLLETAGIEIFKSSFIITITAMLLTYSISLVVNSWRMQ